MNILFDHQIFAIQPYGGVSRYCLELAKALVRLEVEVSLYMGLHQNRYQVDDLPSQASLFFGVRRPKWARMGFVGEGLNRIGLSLFSRRAPFDIYHPSFYGLPLRELSKPLVVTVHDMIHERHPESVAPGSRIPNQKRRAVERADAIVAVSENTRNDLIELWGIDKARIHVVYLASSLPARVSAKRLHARPYLLYVGRRGDRQGYKNFRLILDVISQDPDLKNEVDLLTFGGGPFTSWEEGQIHQAGLGNTVRQLDGDDHTLATLYSHALALVFPSYYEGFGLPVLEAMQQGCPVVASNAASIPEVAGESALYFAPDNGDELAECLRSVIDDDQLRRSLSARGKLRASTFSWDRCAAETLAVYHEVGGQ